jgi:hypothetical protein
MSRKPTRTPAVAPWQNYGLAVLSIGLVPWFPLLIEWTIEWLNSRPIAIDSLVITLACYSITVALATRYLLLSILFLLLSGFDSAIYGALLVAASHDTLRRALVISVLFLLGLLTFASVARERYIRHMQQHEVFPEWLKR